MERVGIIGGGQLGKMMTLEAKKMGFYVAVLDPDEACPSHSISDMHIVAGFDDESAIRQLASTTDVITYEFEHINAGALSRLESNGVKVFPTAKSLSVIQNKFLQKTALKNAGIPVPDFMPARSAEDIGIAAENFGFPMMLKACCGGYDGKGNILLRSADDILAALTEFCGMEMMCERFIPFKLEVSVLTCRSSDGEVKVYSVAENMHLDNILLKTKVPAGIPNETAQYAGKISASVMEVFDGVGMFCVELFVTDNNEIFVNEVAPRPHNSGHYTIEGCMTSQFEQHIRAVCGLPLGDTMLLMPCCMRNILGEPGYFGEAEVIGLSDALKINGAYVHIYDKKITKPKRKMGHLTVVSKTPEDAEQLADEAIGKVKVISKK